MSQVQTQTIAGKNLTQDEIAVWLFFKAAGQPLTFKQIFDSLKFENRQTLSIIITELMKKDLVTTVYMQDLALAYALRSF